jgi:hypothetical protein
VFGIENAGQAAQKNGAPASNDHTDAGHDATATKGERKVEKLRHYCVYIAALEVLNCVAFVSVAADRLGAKVLTVVFSAKFTFQLTLLG